MGFLGPLAAYDFDIVVFKWYQNVLIVCKNMLMYGLHQFWGMPGPLFVKYGILVRFFNIGVIFNMTTI